METGKVERSHSTSISCTDAERSELADAWASASVPRPKILPARPSAGLHSAAASPAMLKSLSVPVMFTFRMRSTTTGRGPSAREEGVASVVS